MVARGVGDAVLGVGDRDVRAWKDGRRGELVDRGLPRRLAGGGGDVVEQVAQDLAFVIGEDVHVQERDARRVVLHLALELEAAPDVRGRVEVEALGEVGRETVEGPAALAQRGVAAGALLDAEAGDGGGDGVEGRLVEACCLRDGGVEEDGGGVAFGVGRGPDDGRGLGVPDLGKARGRDGEGATDLHFGDGVRPCDAPGPGGGIAGQRVGGGVAAEEREPRHGGSDGGPLVGGDRREGEAVLHPVIHPHRRRAGGARPELLLAVAEGGRGRDRLVPFVLGTPRVVQQVDRVRAGEGLARDAAGREFGVEHVGGRDVEPLHRLAAVLHVLDENTGCGGFRRVEIGTQRPRNVAARARQHEGVLLVGVVAGLCGVVLHVDRRRCVAVGLDHARADRGRTILLQEAASRGADGAEDLLGKAAPVGARDAEVRTLNEREASREVVCGAGVGAEQRDDDVAIVEGVVPEEDFAEIHAGARGAGGTADVRPAERAGNDAFEKSGDGESLGVGRQSVDVERKDAPWGDDGRDMVPVVGIVVDRDALLAGLAARGAARGVEAQALLAPLEVEHEVVGAVGRGEGEGRTGAFGDLFGLRPEHHRPAVGREILAFGERGGGVGRGEVEGGVVREDRIGGGAELRGEDDLGRLARARPAHGIDLREGRDFKRLGHRLLLHGGVPPDLEGAGADAVDDRGVGVGVG